MNSYIQQYTFCWFHTEHITQRQPHMHIHICICTYVTSHDMYDDTCIAIRARARAAGGEKETREGFAEAVELEFDFNER